MTRSRVETSLCVFCLPGQGVHGLQDGHTKLVNFIVPSIMTTSGKEARRESCVADVQDMHDRWPSGSVWSADSCFASVACSSVHC